MTTKKGPIAMIRRLFVADRELKIAIEETNRELEAARLRRQARLAQVDRNLAFVRSTMAEIRAEHPASTE